MENGVLNWGDSRLLTETPCDYSYQRKEEKGWVFIKERTTNIVKGGFAFVVNGVDIGVKNEGNWSLTDFLFLVPTSTIKENSLNSEST